MKKIAYFHSGSKNHGCEAIVRTTLELCEFKKDDVLFSKNIDEDIKYGIDKLCCLQLQGYRAKKFNLVRIIIKLIRLLSNNSIIPYRFFS